MGSGRALAAAGSEVGLGRATFRFAPSPNGFLHLGHAYSALLNARMAERAGGRFLLRLEDIDRERCTEAFAAAILDDLAWLELKWDGPVVRQSARFARYRAALDHLAAAGLVYSCFCTRGAIAARVARLESWPRDPDGVPLYPGTCRALGHEERRARTVAGVPSALRLDTAAALARCAGPLEWAEFGEGERARLVRADPAAWGDVVVARKDVPASYHLAVVLDDARQGVTDVVRGEDLFAATGVQRLLQALLGLPPPRYRHHRLVRDARGRKLSKSSRAPAIRALRRDGFTPAQVRALVGLA